MKRSAIQIDAADLESVGTGLPIVRMRGLGNRLRYEYRDLDRGVIFDIARIEVPALATVAELALSGMYDQ